MKIDLTKEEWEFLKDSIESHINNFSPPSYMISNIGIYETYNKILAKLGSEWVDDEK